jgi:hypothetical protein
MANNPLTIISVTPPSPQKMPLPSRLTRRRELQAKFERLWLLEPEQFNPLRNCMQRERLERTYQLIGFGMKVPLWMLSILQKTR